MDNIEQAQLEKVLAVLNRELPETTVLSTEEQSLLAELIAIKAASALYDDGRFEARASILADIKHKLDLTEVRSQQMPVKPLWPKLMIAAAVAVITLGVWLYYFGNASVHREPGSGYALTNDIAPQKMTATLTLENGKTINLSDSKTGIIINSQKFSYNDGSSLRDQVQEPAVQMLTASTQKGGTYQVKLPDGTQVWLNADSKISFPSQFIGKERRVLLSGEAYFEVTKLSRTGLHIPFIVVSNNQQVEVLGTHFNVNSYADEGIVKTTLLEGAVRVVSANSKNSVLLQPNQQAILSGSNQIKVEQADVESVMGWKNGDFVFSGTDLKSVMHEIMRWYGVSVTYDVSVPTDIRLDGWVSRSNNLSVVLRRIESIGNVHFKLEGRRITVTK